MQSKKMSLVESITNVVVGYGINFFAQIVMFKSLGMEVPIHTNLFIGICFTGISLIRSYCLRRVFNRCRELTA